MESRAISDPWLVNQYTYRYDAIRQAPNAFPGSDGFEPESNRRNLVRLVSSTGVAGPTIRGPMPESPSGLGTYANNLNIRMHDGSFQAMNIGIHSAMHDEFASVTTSWWWNRQFTMYVDGVPIYLAGPSAVGTSNASVNEFFYSMNDVSPEAAPRDKIRLFFSADKVFIRGLTLGAARAWYPVHPLFEVWASYGDSFTHRGGYPNSRLLSQDKWDSDLAYNFIRRLAAAEYRAGYGWNNSLGGATYYKGNQRTLWNNGGAADLGSLMSRNPTFVMMAASHNDAGYIGRGASPGEPDYQQRLSEVKADMLEHVEVILTGNSPNWYGSPMTSRAKIGFITTPPSPRQFGWEDSQIQAQIDLNRFVMEDLVDWVTTNLGSAYASRIATYDAAALFGNSGSVEYNPMFTQDGKGIHPNWWGSSLMDQGWWECAVKLAG
jgi:hypothetical protein